jgi:hypothetical protein
VRIGFDVDGVLAAFLPAYHDLIVKMTGRNLFKPEDRKTPSTWYCPEYRGYTGEELSKVWKVITDPESYFWLNLNPLPGVGTLDMMLTAILDDHDLYFITSRPGSGAKWQTEQWLMDHLGFSLEYSHPTVLIASGSPGYVAKRRIAEGLALDCYIDDNFENAVAITQTTKTRSYLLNTNYNQQGSGTFTRVNSVYEFLEAEIIDRRSAA